MANYYAKARTNYFHVTDEEKYKELFVNLVGDDDSVEDFSKTDEDGRLIHGFGCYSSIGYWETPDCAACEHANTCKKSTEEKADCKRDNYQDIDGFVAKLQKILPDGEVFIYLEVGNEKLCYLTGGACVASKAEVKWMDINQWAQEQAKLMTENPNYQARITY